MLAHRIFPGNTPFEKQTNSTLANVEFGAAPSLENVEQFQVNLAVLSGSETIHEAWIVDKQTFQQGNNDLIQWRSSTDLLFCSLTADVPEQADLASITQHSYRRLLQFIGDSAKTNLIRCWNFVPFINEGEGDSENYKLFCTGRLNAFIEACFPATEYPSASAVGQFSNQLLIQTLSSSQPTMHHGNKQQIDAFCYPRQYGVSSPSFARATSLPDSEPSPLFISGTASIRGHETHHINNLTGQLDVTRSNLESLIEDANKRVDDIQTMRVYLRHPEDYQTTRDYLQHHFPHSEKLYLHADICRADLLVEIECFCC